MVSVRLFGTDGIRGRANTHPLTVDLALAFGRAVAYHFFVRRAAAAKAQSGRERGMIVIGKDTRISGSMLESAVAAGIASVGVDVQLVGVLPTPAIAYMAHIQKSPAIVISASHNAFEDNGLKIFQATGLKCDDAVEDEIAGLIWNPDRIQEMPEGDGIGRVFYQKDGAGDYIHLMVQRYKRHGLDLTGVRVVVDTAFGAAHVTTPAILRELGADVIVVNEGEPDGVNINDDCGSTHPELMQRCLRKQGGHLGIAHDGDADRLICADETGELVDGDDLLAIFGTQWLAEGRLKEKTLVATVMSNFGLEECIAKAGGSVVRSAVGDRYVLEQMLALGLNLGGEQSGHLILWEENTTGDGLIAALELLRIMRATGKPASELRQVMHKYPQRLLNLKVPARTPLEEIPGLSEVVSEVERELAGKGRLLLRYSGTESKIRILAETPDESGLDPVLERVAAPIRAHFGL